MSCERITQRVERLMRAAVNAEASSDWLGNMEDGGSVAQDLNAECAEDAAAIREASQSLTRMAGEIERLRRLLWDSYEFIDSERLRDPEHAHHNDRDEFRSRNKQHPILLAKIRAALAEPVGKKP